MALLLRLAAGSRRHNKPSDLPPTCDAQVKPSHLQHKALSSTVTQILANRSAQPVPSTSSMVKSVSESLSEDNVYGTSANNSDVQSPSTPPRCVTPVRTSSFNHSTVASAFTRYCPEQQQAKGLRKLASASENPACTIPPFFAASRQQCTPYNAVPMYPMHQQHMLPAAHCQQQQQQRPALAPHAASQHNNADANNNANGEPLNSNNNGAEDPESVRAHRAEALQRFREKRKRLTFEKKVRYASRKKLAENRPRLRGQFVRQSLDSNSSGSPSNSSHSSDQE
eukprot:4485352-Pyramimonas_sp.AAC.1